jgi:hypothetical protein
MPAQGFVNHRSQHGERRKAFRGVVSGRRELGPELIEQIRVSVELVERPRERRRRRLVSGDDEGEQLLVDLLLATASTGS